ncbi:MAG: hypothetical protein AAGD07_13770 [Planctomycetota bacterium]
MSDGVPDARSGPLLICPTCSLRSDDLLVDAVPPSSDVTCARCGHHAKPLLARLPDGVAPNDWGALRQAIAAEQESRPSQSKRRWITTGVTLRVAKLLQTIASETGSQVVLEADASIAAMAETISRDGIAGATVGDVMRHATGIWMIGDLESSMPRLRSQMMSLDAGRCICTPSVTSDQVAELHAASRSLAKSTSCVPSMTKSEDAILHEADYLAVVWAAKAAASDPETTTALLARWIRDQNEPRRVVLLMMDDAATLKSVFLWRSNQLPETIVSDQSPDLAGTSDDVLTLRVGCPAASSVHPAWLQLGGVDPGVELARYYLPVANVGFKNRDAVIRGDGTVTLPVTAASFESHLQTLPSLLDVLPSLV